MIKKLLIVLLLATTYEAHAVNNTINGKITILHFWEGHTGVLITHENLINPDGCAREDQYILREGHPFFKEYYSLFLAAHLSNKSLKFGLQGCYENFPSIVNVYSYE